VKKIRTEDDLFSMKRSASGLAVLDAWVAIGALHALAEGPKPLDALPGDRRALELTAPILAHLGLLVGDGHRWALSRSARELIDRQVLHPRWEVSDSLGDLSRLRAVIKNGGPVCDADGNPRHTMGGVIPDSTEQTAEFMSLLWRLSDQTCAELLEWTVPRLKPGAKILDLGGGHGRMALEFTKAGFSATVFDLPICIDIARQRNGSRLNYIAGNFHVDALGGPYDAALLSNIVHGESPDANASLLRRLRAHLRPHGLLIVKDLFVDDLGDNPERAVFFGLLMLCYTRAGQSYQLGAYLQLLDEAGFSDPDVVTLSSYQLVFATKSECDS
jgi:2-polyprenyl-3-methyl-5-hydroxy-6-metoxy-1,4-benzoquinol methylase